MDHRCAGGDERVLDRRQRPSDPAQEEKKGLNGDAEKGIAVPWRGEGRQTRDDRMKAAPKGDRYRAWLPLRGNLVDRHGLLVPAA
jgi:hypothetical protein